MHGNSNIYFKKTMRLFPVTSVFEGDGWFSFNLVWNQCCQRQATSWQACFIFRGIGIYILGPKLGLPLGFFFSGLHIWQIHKYCIQIELYYLCYAISKSLIVLNVSCTKSSVLWHYPFSAVYWIKVFVHDNNKCTFDVCK